MSDLKNVNAQIIQRDPTDESVWMGWTDGLIVIRRIIGDTDRETIQLNEVTNDFEAGWVTANPSYIFNITQITSLASDDSIDTLNGTFYDLDSLNSPFDQPFAAPHQVNHTEGWIQWAPQSLDHEQNVRVYFEVISPNSTKRCILLIQRYFGCDISQLKDVNGTTAFAPPVPDCKIEFDSTVQRFFVTVNASYLSDQATYLIDFDDFNGTSDNLRLTYGECSNVNSLDDSAMVPFRTLWYSAPTSTFSHAIDGTFPTYRPRSTWTLSNDGSCNRVIFNSSYSFSNLTHCQNRGGQSYAVTMVIENGMVIYRGNVYVNVLVPLSIDHEDWGYTQFRHVFPFEFGFKQSILSLVAEPSEEALRVFVRSADLNLINGYLTLIIETQYPSSLQVANTSYWPATNFEVTTASNGCENITLFCIQEWVYTSIAPWFTIHDDRIYTFTWLAVNDSHEINATVYLEHQLQQVQSETGLEIGSLRLRTFSNPSSLQLGQDDVTNNHTFAPRDTVFVRVDLAVSEIDMADFDIVITNVWLCYSQIQGYQIEFTESGKQGCLDPFIHPSQRFQLMNNSVPISSSDGIDFETDGLDNITTYLHPSGPSNSFSFISNPQEQVDRIYTLHIETQIVQKTRTSRAIDGSDVHRISSKPGIAKTVRSQSHRYSSIHQRNGLSTAATVNFFVALPPADSYVNQSSHDLRSSFVPRLSPSSIIFIFLGVTCLLIVISGTAFLIWKRRRYSADLIQYSVVDEDLDLEH